MGVLLGCSLPLLFLTLFATTSLCITAVDGKECPESLKSTLLIVFGDSFFDVGYGNEELCLPSGKRPYGKSLDSDGGATGRFSDGLVVPDYIARYLGQADREARVAAYKSGAEIQQTLQSHGKEYASLSFAMAGAGANQTAKKSKSLAVQVETFLNNSAQFFLSDGAKFVGEQDQTLYLFSIGTYDYLVGLKNIKEKKDVEDMADNVTEAIVQQVKRIAEAEGVNGKRFAFMSVALRYLPVVQKAYYQNQTRQNLLDELETFHYGKLAEKLGKLAQKLRATGQGCIINYSILQYHSIIKSIMERPTQYGYDETTIASACCGDGSFKADGCGHSDENGCNDPSAYVFWDGMHPTQHINQEIARIFWDGPKDVASPQNLLSLAGTTKPQYDFSVNANELISIQATVTLTLTKTLETWTTKEEVTHSAVSN